jgi:hypothetical protein
MLRAVVSRFIAISLLLIFAGDTALLALLADSESSLPACCRRDGKHHCAMMEKETAGPSWRTATRKCPLFPKSTVAFFTDQAVPSPIVCVAGWIASQPADKAQTEVLYRISHSRTRQKRGPPSFV